MTDLWGNEDNLFGGGTAQSWAEGYDVLLMKWNKTSGTLVKNVTWGTSSSERVREMWGTTSGIVLCCDYWDDNGGSYDILLLKYDFNLNLLWQKEWGTSARELPWSIWSDGLYYYVCGNNNKSGNYDMMLVKFDLSGNAIWESEWGGPASEEGFDVWGDATGIYTVGSTASYGAGGYDLALVKWDYAGNVLWNRTWGTPPNDYGRDVWSNGTRVFVSGAMNSGSNPSDLELLAWDASGTLLWNTTFVRDITDSPQEMWVTDTAIYQTSTSFYSGSSYDYLVVKYDREGNYLWNVSWGTSGSDEMRGVFGDTSGLYLCGNSGSTGGGDVITIKYNESAAAALDGIYHASVPTPDPDPACDLLCILLILVVVAVVSVVAIYELYQHLHVTRGKDDMAPKQDQKGDLDFG